MIRVKIQENVKKKQSNLNSNNLRKESRLCKVLLRNDYWCKGLGLTQPKSEAYGKYLQLKKQKTVGIEA